MKKLFLLAVAGLLACSCTNSGNNTQATQEQPKQKEVVITSDMENAAGKVPSWGNEITVVAMPAPGKAHSGEFVSKVDKDNLYSYTYLEQFKNINNVVPRKVIVSGWINCPEYSEETLIAMDINDNNKSVLWKGNPISRFVKSQNEWYEFTTEFLIDQPVTNDYQVKIFGFGGKKTAYFDDFKITFEY